MSKRSTEILFLGRKSFRMRPKSGDLPRRIKKNANFGGKDNSKW